MQLEDLKREYDKLQKNMEQKNLTQFIMEDVLKIQIYVLYL